MKSFEREITRIFVEAGPGGLSIKKSAIHLHNSLNTLFCPVEFNEIYRFVTNFVHRNSHGKCPMLVTAGKRGRYRINRLYSEMPLLEQMYMAAEDIIIQDTAEKPDKQLSIFELSDSE